MDWGAAFAGGSVLVAVVAMIIELRVGRKVSVKQHTIDILSNFFNNEAFLASRRSLTGWRRSGRQFPDDDVAPEDDAVIITVLNFYDFVCALALDGEIDSRILTMFGGGAIKADYVMFAAYTTARRARLNRPRLYQSIEDYYEKKLKNAVTN